MISDVRKKEIDNVILSINSFSEKYQLIHATVAVEKLYRNKLQDYFSSKYRDIREKIQVENDEDKLQELMNQALEIREESKRKIIISIEYSDKMLDNTGRVVQTPNNVFLISLPKSASSFRDENGEINFDRLGALRKLMAHELGHLILESELLGLKKPSAEDKEEETEYFAEKLLEVRRMHSLELSKGDNSCF